MGVDGVLYIFIKRESSTERQCGRMVYLKTLFVSKFGHYSAFIFKYNLLECVITMVSNLWKKVIIGKRILGQSITVTYVTILVIFVSELLSFLVRSALELQQNMF